MRGPLVGIVVVDLSRALAGPHAAMMLGDLGARVVKVESPAGGDDARSWGPPFVGPEDDEQSTYFLSCNRNKQSIALDLKSEDGKEVLRALLRKADVVIENFRAGVMTRLGFSTSELLEINPRLVILSITGFGHDGPEALRAGYDQIVQGEAGLMSLTGSGPDDVQRVGVPVADLLSGIYGAFGVVSALFERISSGRGQVVRTSLLSSIVGIHAFQGTMATVAHAVPQAQGNHHPSIAPYGLFHCRDGSVQISVGNNNLWRRFCDNFGIDPATPGLETNSMRVKNRARTIATVEEAFSVFDAEQLLVLLDAAGIPAGKVRTLDEVYQWPQLLSQGLKISVDHSTLGPIDLPGPPIRFFDAADGAEVEITRTEHTAPPTLGEHAETIQAWLDESAE